MELELVRTEVMGWGADARREDRPGVPEELTPPHPLGKPYWTTPEQQTSGRPTAKAAYKPLTPVYGTAVPPRGVSGLLRRVAYRIPDYRARRWMLLVAADRIDVIEHNVVPLAALVGIVALGAFGIRALRAR